MCERVIQQSSQIFYIDLHWFFTLIDVLGFPNFLIMKILLNVISSDSLLNCQIKRETDNILQYYKKYKNTHLQYKQWILLTMDLSKTFPFIRKNINTFLQYNTSPNLLVKENSFKNPILKLKNKPFTNLKILMIDICYSSKFLF